MNHTGVPDGISVPRMYHLKDNSNRPAPDDFIGTIQDNPFYDPDNLLMFTGIIQTVGHITQIQPHGGDLRLHIQTAQSDFSDVLIGDSIAVSGVCLTVVTREAQGFSADVSNETLSLTTLGKLKVGDPLNLEKSLRMGDRLGGHLLLGHVDGLGKVVRISPDDRSQRWTFKVPARLTRYIAVKGSISIDGTSLTVNTLEDTRFDVNLIPHTLAHTTFHQRQPGDAVNIEVDLIARYVERLVTSNDTPTTDTKGF